ncbi:MAG: prefoldin subunit beta [Candidatus Woesearchaeota archaeon]
MTVEEKIQQLQLIEQTMQQTLVQKQHFQRQLAEVESALEELQKSNEAYKIVGNVMIKTDIKNLKKELEEKKETNSLRLKSIEKQEKQMREKAEQMQKDVMEALKKKNE